MSYINNPAAGGGGTGTPGGSTGQIQYNAGGGNFGGFTASGDATINTGTGVVTLSNGVGVSAPFTIKGNNTGVSGPPIDLSIIQSVQLLDLTEAWHTLCGGV
jgi:hypothetical protein